MEKDIAKIQKNSETDIVIRVDDYGGKTGVTIREFVTSDKYTGFTKAGTRIPADKFIEFREAINAIELKDLETSSVNHAHSTSHSSSHSAKEKKIVEEISDEEVI
jgi:hypothetical protein